MSRNTKLTSHLKPCYHYSKELSSYVILILNLIWYIKNKITIMIYIQNFFYSLIVDTNRSSDWSDIQWIWSNRWYKWIIGLIGNKLSDWSEIWWTIRSNWWYKRMNPNPFFFRWFHQRSGLIRFRVYLYPRINSKNGKLEVWHGVTNLKSRNTGNMLLWRQKTKFFFIIKNVLLL